MYNHQRQAASGVLAMFTLLLLTSDCLLPGQLPAQQFSRSRRVAEPVPQPRDARPQDGRLASRQDPRGGLRTLQQRDNPQARKIGTNLRAFGIPFTVANPEDRFVEVQLYSSRDLGQSWDFHSRQPPAATEFRFENHVDGEYWFAIRTLYRDRQLHPAGAMLPELKVVVDTVRPELDFRIQTDAAGRIVCRWTCRDPNIDPASTRVAFRPLISTDDVQNQWLSVPYKPVASVVDGTFSDQYAWWPEPRSREVLVQLAIRDIAGNEAIEERQIVLPPVSTAPGQMALATPGTTPPANIDFAGIGKGSGKSMFEVSSTTHSPGPENEYQSDKTPLDENASPPASGPQPLQPLMYGMLPAPNGPKGLPAQPPGSTQADIAWSSQTVGNSGLQPVVQTGRPTYSDTRPVMTGSDSEQSVRHFAGGQESQPGNREPSTGLIPAPPADPMTAARTASAILPNNASSVPPSPAPGGTGGQSVLSSENDVRYMNSRRFRLDYSLDSLVPNSISKVVLWVTADRGKTWTAWAEDTDHESPFPVEMETAGLYGFRIVFHTMDGLAGPAPRSGDSADVWIKIDLDHPEAQLTGAPYGTGHQAGRLLIEWTATDEMLRNRPVRLSYSVGRSGPWTLIEDGLDNHGQYAWKPDSSVPERVFLRLDVTDAAGNVSTSATDQPVDLRGLIPRGRILDVQPVR